jgi:predicted MPP superfamily phosphohydrolase
MKLGVPITRAGSRGWRAVLGVAIVVLFGALVARDFQGAWYEEGDRHRVIGKLAIYWFSWLLWPALLLLARETWRTARRRKPAATVAGVFALALCTCFTWARFIEPNWLQVRETTLGTSCGMRVALISDLHVGLFVREPDLQRLVDRLNTLQVDAVLVAGDWTFEPGHDLRSTFAPLAGLRHRTLSVLGNHDEQRPGPPLRDDLQQALAAAHVEPIDGRRVPLGRCELQGLGDRSAGSAERDLAASRRQPWTVDRAHRVMLTHNPDTVFDLEPDEAALLLAGHTHGGQIDIPVFTKHLLAHATDGGFRQGLYELKNARVFVTPGVGIDKLPVRFRVPPTIDVLSF